MTPAYLLQLKLKEEEARQALLDLVAQRADQSLIAAKKLELQRCEGTYAEAQRDSVAPTAEERDAKLRAIEKRNNDAALAMRMR